MFYRCYLTPDGLAKMYKDMPNNCWKYAECVDKFYHMCWTWEKICKFQIIVYILIETILQVSIPFKPEVFLLNCIPNGIDYNQRCFIIHVVTEASKLQHHTEKCQILLMKIMETADMDKLILILKGQIEEDFAELWTLFIA